MSGAETGGRAHNEKSGSSSRCQELQQQVGGSMDRVGWWGACGHAAARGRLWLVDVHCNDCSCLWQEV